MNEDRTSHDSPFDDDLLTAGLSSFLDGEAATEAVGQDRIPVKAEEGAAPAAPVASPPAPPAPAHPAPRLISSHGIGRRTAPPPATAGQERPIRIAEAGPTPNPAGPAVPPAPAAGRPHAAPPGAGRVAGAPGAPAGGSVVPKDRPVRPAPASGTVLRPAGASASSPRPIGASQLRPTSSVASEARRPLAPAPPHNLSPAPPQNLAPSAVRTAGTPGLEATATMAETAPEPRMPEPAETSPPAAADTTLLAAPARNILNLASAAETNAEAVTAPQDAAPAAAAAPQENDPPQPAANTAAAGMVQLEATLKDIDNEIRAAPMPALAEQAAGDTEGLASCIVFGLGGTRYALPITSVTELNVVPRTTPLPRMPHFVRGLANLRGEVIAVLDIRLLLGLDAGEPTPQSRILVVNTRRGQTAALLVDEVRGTAGYSPSRLVQPTGRLPDRAAGLLLGVSEHQEQILNIVDVEKLFDTPEIQLLAGAEGQ